MSGSLKDALVEDGFTALNTLSGPADENGWIRHGDEWAYRATEILSVTIKFGKEPPPKAAA